MSEPEIPRRKRLFRAAFWVFGAMALAAAVLLPLSFLTTRSVATSRHEVVLHRGKIEFASFSSVFTRSGALWVSAAGPRILVGASSEWLPSRAKAAIGTSGPGGTMVSYSIDVFYVPLVFVGGVALAGAGGFWMLARRVYAAGACRRCGYDMRGTPGDRCPECGREESVVRRVARFLGLDARGRAWHAAQS